MPKLPLIGDSNRVLDEGLEGLDHNFLTGRLEDLVKWSRCPEHVACNVRSGLLRASR